MKNICFVNSIKFWGGGEKLHLELAESFKNKGYQLWVVCQKGSPLAKKADEAGLPVYNMNITNLSFLNPFKIIELYQLFKKHKIDTVFFSSSQDFKMASLTTYFAKIPLVIYLRGLAVPIKKKFFNILFLKNCVTHIIVNSLETKRTILENLENKIEESKIKVIYHGINITEYNPQKIKKMEVIANANPKKIILGNAARLTKQKGQIHLIKIAKILKSKNIPFVLYIAGEGRERQILQQKIQEYQLESEVILLGFVENVQNFINSVDVFLLSSLWEGFGFAIVEAMALKKPVIAFDLSSNSEIIQDKRSGYLIPYPKLEEFAQKIINFAQDSNLIEQMGEQARESVKENFELSNIVKQIEIELKNIPTNKDLI